MARKSGTDARTTRDSIARSAQTLFARDGYAAVSMRQIASAAGVQAGAIYLHFADKQALLYELMEAHMDALLAAWEATPRADDPVERLRQFAMFHITYHLERPEEVFIAYMELRNLTPANFAAIEARRRAYEAELERILEDGRAAGEFHFPDLRLTSMGIIAMLTGVNTWFRPEGRLRPARVARIYGRFAWRLAGKRHKPGGAEDQDD